MEFDLRFVEVGYELGMLSEYVRLLESNMPTIVEAEKKRIWSGLDPNDEADRSSAYHLEDRLEEGVSTRFLAGAAIMATWAIYEATVQRMADYVREKNKVSLKMNHLRGNFLQRARRYYEDVLKFELHAASADWERLERLADLRHVMAHANGNLGDITPDDLRRMESWLKNTRGLTVIDDEYLVVQVTFARDTLKFVEGLLDDLVERVRKAL